jgi:hypothetical protein
MAEQEIPYRNCVANLPDDSLVARKLVAGVDVDQCEVKVAW